MKNLIIAVLAAIFACGAVQGATVTSPDGNISVSAQVKDDGNVQGALMWSVAYKGHPILAESPLGLDLKDARPLAAGFKVIDIIRSTADTVWQPVYGERSEIRDHYNEIVLTLQDDQPSPRTLLLTVRAYNEGAAFRYTIPRQDAIKDFTITAEQSHFCFTADHTAWAVYSAQGVYSKVRLSGIKPNCERPLTIEIDNGPAVAVAEAALVDYARMRLQPADGKAFAVRSMLSSEVKGSAPFSTPWRVVMIADDVCKLLENNSIILNLNAPCAIEDTSWIKPGKVIREVSLTTRGGMDCVDFAVDRGLQYVEYDAGWYGYEYSDASDASTINVDPKRSKGPLDLHEVIRYAESRGIGILLYVNRRAMERQLDKILPLYKRWGVKGVKYGFVRVGDQKWTAWLHEAIQKAAENQLMVDVHDEYRPTGFSRTYPNLMTMEGIRGNECMPTAEENLVLPFTRYLCGAGDYTICWYDSRIKNTSAHQLAASVVYYSPLQFVFWYDRPIQYKGEKQLEFFKYVPTVWDQTRVLQGGIGEYVTIARQSGAEWFVGTMNAGKRRRLTIPLDFLLPGTKYMARIYSDAMPKGGSRTSVSISRQVVDNRSIIRADLAHNGGQAIRFVPLN